MFFFSRLKCILSFTTFGFFSICSLIASPSVVAITQIAPHPSLDTIRAGIVREITATLPDVQILFENAQGNIVVASQIARKMVDSEPQVIIPITTPCAQAVYQFARLFRIPVVFAAITDPVSAKLIPSLEGPGDNITGVADVPPLEKQLLLIKEIIPSAQSIGIIYNAGEANSVSVVNQALILAKAIGFTIFSVSITNTIDVSMATQSLIGKVDAIFVINDNTVVSALDSLLKITNRYHIPVFASDPDSVERGCVAAFAPSQYEIGRQVGRLALRVLSGESINNIPVEQPTLFELSVNKKAASHVAIKIPESVLTRANFTIN